MNAEILRRAGTRKLFREALETYQRAVEKRVKHACTFADLGNPQVVLNCLDRLSETLIDFAGTWCETMLKELSDDDEPDTEPSKDDWYSTLTEAKLYDVQHRVTRRLKELGIGK